ncbi:unnamed protein product [Adineta ricciae]|uniref:Uncharacterized protein n=1 Tax=Adineta ricciae TaxID=249248 RepID=A0A814V897_ADIRI|nr:unnamed protein product [Adineta ricciae]CAF1184664.1 unnamed protein product [Adineta ricciae]
MNDTTELNICSNQYHERSKDVLTTREKRAMYMVRLRGERDSEYRRIERENNARAMRRKRLEDPLYRENERQRNRAHMARIRRENSLYRQQEHLKNRDRMASKRHSLLPQPAQTNSIYKTLENNLQSSHISLISYQTHFEISTDPKQRTEYQFLQHIDVFCRQNGITSHSDNDTPS